ncbi:NADH-quinone oxidoreductase subunit A [bacterium]|nr:NADH-quinone oxidoreductase subunit A [bacterium]MCB1219198.1 NADH-quinone oxidoreductase subunit A [bacterium]UNM09587.1 MAG: NADH-quinone oxidoreductase subunit A [Planctomycetales bacterium]
MNTVGQYNWVALFLLGGAVLIGLAFAFLNLWRPRRPNFLKRLSYESGAQATGDALVRFNIRFYILAIVFLMFDVDIMFIFPWATAFRLLVFGNDDITFTPIGAASLGEMFVFLGILLVGWAYAYRKGALEWV